MRLAGGTVSTWDTHFASKRERWSVNIPVGLAPGPAWPAPRWDQTSHTINRSSAKLDAVPGIHIGEYCGDINDPDNGERANCTRVEREPAYKGPAGENACSPGALMHAALILMDTRLSWDNGNVGRHNVLQRQTTTTVVPTCDWQQSKQVHHNPPSSARWQLRLMWQLHAKSVARDVNMKEEEISSIVFSILLCLP